VEDSLWDQYFHNPPGDTDGCAYALQKGDQTFTRLQHRINSTRRAFHTALKELERLEARDRDVAIVEVGGTEPATDSPESQLPVLGSLRKIADDEPADAA
jgi:DNA-binding HxlR family transcriptional regulator